MSERKSRGIMVRGGRQILALAALSALVLALAGSSRAQSQSTASKSAQASTPPSAKVATVNAAPATQAATPKPAAEPTAPAGQSAPKGQFEGIKVHGHWTIEVKNPDGRVVSHSEFENNLSSGFPFGPFFSGGGSLPGGSSLLSAVMAGQTIVTPVAWAILLEGPSYPNLTSAPCVIIGGYVGGCLLIQNSPSSVLAGADEGFSCPGSVTNPLPPGISCTLAVNPLGTAPSFTGFQLSGSVVATQGGTISAVATMDANACGENGNLANCAFTSSLGVVAFTAKNLDGNTVPGDPYPVTVIAGQTVQVTVNFSFM